MSKYTVIGDLHLEHSNIDKVKKLFNQIESMGNNTIFLGDMLNRRGLIEASCLNLLYKLFSDSRRLHTIICGNHDQLSISSMEHSLEPLKSLPNVIIYDKPGTFDNILFMPYYRNPNQFLADLNKNSKYLFCHQGVKEFSMGSGYTDNEAIDIKELAHFDRCVIGHYHSPMEKDNVVYLGTPFSHSFGESNEVKRLGIFDSETGELEYIKTDFPRHITVNLDLSRSDILDIDYYDNNRVILLGSREQIALFDKSKYPGVKFIEECTSEVVKTVLKETQTPQSMFDNWFKDVKKETNPEIYELGLKILDEVK